MEQNEEFDNWFKKWEEDNPKLAEWKKKQLQKFYAFPQKVFVGMSDSEGNWTDIGVMDPDEPLKLEMQSEFPPETVKPKKVVLDKFLGDESLSLQSYLYQYQASVTTLTSVAEYDKSFQEMLWKVGHHQTAPVWDKMKNQMPEMNQMVECPGGFGACWWTSSVWSMVQHLNDSHRWSREAIADWLEESGNNPEFPIPEDVPKEPGEE